MLQIFLNGMGLSLGVSKFQVGYLFSKKKPLFM